MQYTNFAQLIYFSGIALVINSFDIPTFGLNDGTR